MRAEPGSAWTAEGGCPHMSSDCDRSVAAFRFNAES